MSSCLPDPRAQTGLQAHNLPSRGELYQREIVSWESVLSQQGKPSTESLWPNFNLTDNFESQNQCLGPLRCLSSRFNFTGILLWLLRKCSVLKSLVSSKQGFPVRRTVQLIKGVREKQRLASLAGSEKRAGGSCPWASLPDPLGPDPIDIPASHLSLSLDVCVSSYLARAS